jgi:thiol:disulfide interchange protein
LPGVVEARAGRDESLVKRAVPHRGRASSSPFQRVRFATVVVAALVAGPQAAAGDEEVPAAAAAPAPDPAPAEAPVALTTPTDPAHSGPQLEFAPFHDKLFVEARRSGDPVALYFEADWCHPCREMHARTFREPAVLEAAADYQLFRVDMTRPGPYLELLEKSFRVLGAPTVILFGPDGKERSRRFGFIPPEDFARMLEEGRKPAPRS